MGAVQIPDQLKQLIDRQVAAGRAASEAAYVIDALRAYAGHVDAQDEIAAIADRADAEMAAGRFVTVNGDDDGEALHARAMTRLRARMAKDILGR